MAVQWWRVKKAYLQGGMTYRQLSEKFGIPAKTIQNRASKEGWPKEKGKIREEVGKELRAQVARTRVAQLEKIAEANEMFIDGLLEMARAIQNNPKTNLRDQAKSLKNAESMAKALQTAMMTQRDLYRLANIDQELARDKYKLDKKKWETEQKEKAAGAAEVSGTVWQIEQPEDGGEAVDG